MRFGRFRRRLVQHRLNLPLNKGEGPRALDRQTAKPGGFFEVKQVICKVLDRLTLICPETGCHTKATDHFHRERRHGTPLPRRPRQLDVNLPRQESQ
jgi:hypothetical protein